VGYCLYDGYFVLQRPIAQPGNDSVDRAYPYGSTEGGTRDPHHGVEFENASGTPVLAAADGTVVYAGEDKTTLFSPWPDFYGNLVVVKHDLPDTPFGTLYTLYAHLSKVDVSTGQSVMAGQKIGEVGRTGTAEGSHLHFEVRLEAQDYGSTLNPELWLVPHPGDGLLALRAMDETGTLLRISPNVQYYPDKSQPAAWGIQPEPYAPETTNARSPWQEIAAVGDLPAGQYRLAFVWLGVVYERWVQIESGKLTVVTFVIK
jgi:murein DD-endopeptidase MepM/ murein hydrolase activator NlpD